MIVTVDMDCCRCSAKIHKVLSSIQDRGKFPIEKIVYGEEKVLVSGPFDADELSCKLRCKAGKVIRNIEVAKPPASKPKPKPDPPKPKIDEKPTEPEPKPVPYAYPYPCPYPSTWPCAPYCECHSKPPAPPPVPAPTCQCPPYQMPMPMQCAPVVFCEETPPYGACAVM